MILGGAACSILWTFVSALKQEAYGRPESLQHLDFKGWNPHVRGEFPGNYESSDAAMRNF